MTLSLVSIEDISLAIVLSPETQAKVEQIPDFARRLDRFINDQYALEQWRARRMRTDVADLVNESLAEGARLKAAGIDREALFERLLALVEQIPGEQQSDD